MHRREMASAGADRGAGGDATKMVMDAHAWVNVHYMLDKCLVVESTGGINGDHSSAEAEFGAFLGNLANECRLVVYNFQYINTNVNPAMPQQKSIAFTL